MRLDKIMITLFTFRLEFDAEMRRDSLLFNVEEKKL